MPDATTPRFRNFFLIWLGQTLSLFGTGLTGFGLGVWVYERTGSVTAFTLIFVSGSIPPLLLAPISGVLVDRWDRRWTMILSDSGAAIGTMLFIVLLATGRMEVWHLYAIVAFGACFMSLQVPAFMASVSLMIPKKHLGRAGGMMQFGQSAARILAPLAGGLLLPLIGLRGIIAIDLGTFAVSVVILFIVAIPRPERSAASLAAKGKIYREALYGLRYITERKGLIALLAFFAVLNLFFALGQVLTTPLVLSFASTKELGVVLALGSAGMLLGALAMSTWGGPKRRVFGVLGFSPVLGMAMVMIGLEPSLVLVATGVFLLFSVVPIINSSDQALWQTKVTPDVQGRVFAFRRLFAQCTAPIAYLAGGPLADRVFEPLMAEGGGLDGTAVAAVLGTGEGRGVALLYLLMGLGLLIATAIALTSPGFRRLDLDLPDAQGDHAEALS